MIELVLALCQGPAAMATSVGLGILAGAMIVSVRFGISYRAAFQLIIARLRRWLGW